MTRKAILFMVFLFTAYYSAFSQDIKVVEDLELWTGAKFRYFVFNDKLATSVEAETRFRKDMTELKSFYVEPALSYEVFDFMELGAAFRYTNRNTRKSNTEHLYRYILGANFKYNIDRFRLRYRFLYQNTDDEFLRRDTIYKSINVVRNRITIRYKIKKSVFIPYVSGELHTSFKDQQFNTFNLRLTVGTDIKLTPKLNTKLFYRTDRELNSDFAYTFYIIGLRFIFIGN